MTLLDILTRELEGKKVIGGKVPLTMIGATIINVQLNCYEPIFEVVARQPNGAIEVFDVDGDLDIVVE